MKKERIAILIPTKDRVEDFIIFANSWVANTENLSDVIVGIDIGDTKYDEVKLMFPTFIWEEIQPQPFLYILNDLAVKYAAEYKYIAFMEDDCNFNTKFESVFINTINEIGDYGIVWGNDLLNGAYIVGLPFMDSKIINVLGYMTPPEIKYLWADHFWKQIGEALGTLHYFPDVIVEHRHYSTGKREKDPLSLEVDTKGQEDFIGYNKHYKPLKFNNDIQKLINARS